MLAIPIILTVPILAKGHDKSRSVEEAVTTL
jgi:hypothetical protein